MIYFGQMIYYRRASGAKENEGIGKPTYVHTGWNSGQIEGKPKLGFPLIAATSLRNHPSGQMFKLKKQTRRTPTLEDQLLQATRPFGQ
jgi:hypothetical protein